MKLYLSLIAFFIGLANMQAQLNMTEIAHVDFTSDYGDGNDVWGYVAPDGTEYAIIGARNGTIVYSLEDPSNPIERAFIPGSSSTWRDMKQWGEYVYVTADSGNDGLLIIDMTGAPNTIDHKYLYPEVLTSEGDIKILERCHNIFIDENGIIYLAGCQGGGVEFFDPKTDPLNPSYIGSLFNPYSHDSYAKGDTLYASEIYDHFSLYDVSDKQNPILLGTVETSSDFTHNAWGDPTNHYAFTTDEKGYAYLDAYDISDPENIEFLDKWQPNDPNGVGIIPHNTHYLNGYLVTSWYTSGVIVVDGNRPENLVKIAEYDTYDGPDGGFSGCWGVTPFLPSGIVLVNDINSGFYVFDVNYTRACYLEGVITDFVTGNTISGVSLEFDTEDIDEPTANSMGEYKVGQEAEATVTVTYSHPEYFPKTVSYDLKKAEVVNGDVQLIPKMKFNLSITTIVDANGNPIPNAIVEVKGEEVSYDLLADENGIATVELVAGEYQIIAGKWGYHQNILSSIEVIQNTDATIELTDGYADSFILDLGWTVDAGAETGNWERTDPIGTISGGQLVNPEDDAPNGGIEIGNLCYVTESEQGGVGDADVDNGTTTITSPLMDWINTGYNALSYSVWFANSGGNTPINDALIISLTNGVSTIVLDEITGNQAQWNVKQHLIPEIEYTENMQLIVSTSDGELGHIVEAGFDAFNVFTVVNNENEAFAPNISIFPNPSNGQFTYQIDAELDRIIIYDMMGRKINELPAMESSGTLELSGLNSGVYHLSFVTKNGQFTTKKVSIIHN